MKLEQCIRQLETGGFDGTLEMLYGTQAVSRQRARYLDAIRKFREIFPEREEIHIYSAPGRTEIGGNHTDHQHGCVLAAAVDLDVIAIAAFHEDGIIRLESAGYPRDTVELDDLTVHPSETGTSAALIRGVVSRFQEKGVTVSGMDAYTTSNVLSGSGLSSSAAFEVLIGTMLDSYYYGGTLGAVEIAKISQYAENAYFGKNSGLMDQMVSAVGGLVAMDFCSTENPEIRSFSCDFEQAGYCLCITDTKESHANLTGDYDAIRSEMESIAAQFGKTVLREVDEEAFYQAVPELRKTCSDRAVLRAAHFFAENRRAVQEAEALESGDMDAFLALVNQSGDSSATLLQNLYSCMHPAQQAIPLGIWMSRRVLGQAGAVRVHGGGFAGTIQAFVPIEKKQAYVQEMNRIFGEGSCYVLRIRPVGGVELTEV
ncbi:MAG: galactokinase [Ruminococcus sp.]